MGYLCANFSLPRPLCSRLRPDVRDRQTDVRRASSLNAPYPRGGGIITVVDGNNADSRATSPLWPMCLSFRISSCSAVESGIVNQRRLGNMSRRMLMYCRRTRLACDVNLTTPVARFLRSGFFAADRVFIACRHANGCRARYCCGRSVRLSLKLWYWICCMYNCKL